MANKVGSAPRSVLSRVFLLLGTALVFTAGFITGGSYQLERQKLNLGEFWRTYSIVESEFVGDIDKRQAVEGVTRGFIQSLGDPFSDYLSADERGALSDELSGELEGIGARLEMKDGSIVVVAPLTDSPAEKAGLRPNDIILAVDDESTKTMSLDEAVKNIRGPQGTQVTLTVLRQGANQPLELAITRAAILIPSVTWEMKGDVAYMQITQFGADTPALTLRGLNELKAKDPSAFILDLRNNPGGYLEDVPPIAGGFIPPSVVVIQKFKLKKSEELRSTGVPVFPTTKMFVLVNEGSASASEILAGALQDHGRTTVVGRKTFGKGSVQDIIPLGRGTALRLTVAEWLTPKGRVVDKVGITPDVVVEGESTEESDPILEKALELARQ
jgi:carboxyl-terminal processing protease